MWVLYGSVPGYTYHVTHRRYNGSYLFRFALDRDVSQKMLRDRLRKYPVSEVGERIPNRMKVVVESMGDVVEQEFWEDGELKLASSGTELLR